MRHSLGQSGFRVDEGHGVAFSLRTEKRMKKNLNQQPRAIALSPSCLSISEMSAQADKRERKIIMLTVRIIDDRVQFDVLLVPVPSWKCVAAKPSQNFFENWPWPHWDLSVRSGSPSPWPKGCGGRSVAGLQLARPMGRGGEPPACQTSQSFACEMHHPPISSCLPPTSCNLCVVVWVGWALLVLGSFVS